MFESTNGDQVAESATELDRAFERYTEDLNAKFDSVVKLLARVNQTLDHGVAEIRNELRRGFAETQALIASLNTQSARRE